MVEHPPASSAPPGGGPLPGQTLSRRGTLAPAAAAAAAPKKPTLGSVFKVSLFVQLIKKRKRHL